METLTNNELFYGALVFFAVLFLMWKSRDVHFLKERRQLLESRYSTDKAKFHHQWWHNWGLGFIGAMVTGMVIFALGITWNAVCLGVAVASLFMIMDIVLNMKMNWPTWHLGNGWFDIYVDWPVRFGLFIISNITFILIN